MTHMELSKVLINRSIDEVKEACEKVGVNITNSDGSYKTIDEVFSELSEVWNKDIESTSKVECPECGFLEFDVYDCGYSFDGKEHWADCCCDECGAQFVVKYEMVSIEEE